MHLERRLQPAATPKRRIHPEVAERCLQPAARASFLGWHERGYLPHFDVPYLTQFVTFMLYDGFPVTRRPEWDGILNEPDDSQRRRKLEAWLDRGHGECWLRRADLASLVEEKLRESDGKKYRLQAWAVMPNHLHLVVDVWAMPLSKLLNLWKGASALAVNLALNRRGRFWEREYFDTMDNVASDLDVRFGGSRFKQEKGTSFVQDLAGLGLAAVAPFEIIRRISQNFSPAGVTSPFEARAMPTDATSVEPVSGR